MVFWNFSINSPMHPTNFTININGCCGKVTNNKP